MNQVLLTYLLYLNKYLDDADDYDYITHTYNEIYIVIITYKNITIYIITNLY